MDWYKRDPAAYRADTWGLSLAAHGAYNLLLDHYYATERPLPADDRALAAICGCSLAEWNKVKTDVTRYFTVTNGMLRHTKCDAVIDDALNDRRFASQRQARFRKRLIENNNSEASVTRDIAVSHGTREEKNLKEEARQSQAVDKGLNGKRPPRRWPGLRLPGLRPGDASPGAPDEA